MGLGLCGLHTGDKSGLRAKCGAAPLLPPRRPRALQSAPAFASSSPGSSSRRAASTSQGPGRASPARAPFVPALPTEGDGSSRRQERNLEAASWLSGPNYGANRGPPGEQQLPSLPSSSSGETLQGLSRSRSRSRRRWGRPAEEEAALRLARRGAASETRRWLR